MAFIKTVSVVIGTSLTNLNYDAILNKPTLTSQWTTSGANIYYNTGNVGIGIAAGGYKLTHIVTSFLLEYPLFSWTIHFSPG